MIKRYANMKNDDLNKRIVPTDENGDLDIKLLKKLPLEDKLEIQVFMTPDQWKYYCNKIIIQKGPIKKVFVEYTLEDEEDWGWGVDADKFLAKIKEKYLKK